MKAWKAALGGGVSAAFGLLQPWRGDAGCRVLMYHAIGSAVPEDAAGLYSMSPQRFREQMHWLAKQHAPAVTGLDQAVAAGSGIAITFDDGYGDLLTAAAPILVGCGFPFTVFVTPGFVSDPSGLYLTPADLRTLAALPGVTIGAHGNSHRRLTECSDAELIAELAGSRAWLEDAVAKPVTSMSYPHGAVDIRVRDAAAAAGYELAACSRFGAHRRDGDRLCVARTDIWAQDDARRFAAKVAGAWDWMKWLT